MEGMSVGCVILGVVVDRLVVVVLVDEVVLGAAVTSTLHAFSSIRFLTRGKTLKSRAYT